MHHCFPSIYIFGCIKNTLYGNTHNSSQLKTCLTEMYKPVATLSVLSARHIFLNSLKYLIRIQSIKSNIRILKKGENNKILKREVHRTHDVLQRVLASSGSV